MKGARHATPAGVQQPVQQPQDIRQAAERYQVTPCIVIGVGDVVSTQFEYLRHSIEFWLGASFPIGAVGWGCVVSPQDVTAEWASQLLHQVTNLELWQYLLEGSYVDQELQPGDLAPVRIYIIYDPGMKTNELDVTLLKAVSDTLFQVATGSASLHLSLIMPWLGGELIPDPTRSS